MNTDIMNTTNLLPDQLAPEQLTSDQLTPDHFWFCFHEHVFDVCYSAAREGEHAEHALSLL